MKNFVPMFFYFHHSLDAKIIISRKKMPLRNQNLRAKLREPKVLIWVCKNYITLTPKECLIYPNIIRYLTINCSLKAPADFCSARSLRIAFAGKPALSMGRVRRGFGDIAMQDITFLWRWKTRAGAGADRRPKLRSIGSNVLMIPIAAQMQATSFRVKNSVMPSTKFILEISLLCDESRPAIPATEILVGAFWNF